MGGEAGRGRQPFGDQGDMVWGRGVAGGWQGMREGGGEVYEFQQGATVARVSFSI